jgi:hypothetical protein
MRGMTLIGIGIPTGPLGAEDGARAKARRKREQHGEHENKGFGLKSYVTFVLLS